MTDNHNTLHYRHTDPCLKKKKKGIVPINKKRKNRSHRKSQTFDSVCEKRLFFIKDNKLTKWRGKRIREKDSVCN